MSVNRLDYTKEDNFEIRNDLINNVNTALQPFQVCIHLGAYALLSNYLAILSFDTLNVSM